MSSVEGRFGMRTDAAGVGGRMPVPPPPAARSGGSSGLGAALAGGRGWGGWSWRALLAALSCAALAVPLGSPAAAHPQDAGSVHTCAEFVRSAYSVQEGSDAQLTLRLRHELDVDVTVTLGHQDSTSGGSWTATAGTDFVGGNYSMTFPAGTTQQTLSIGTTLDKAPGDKTFEVVIRTSDVNRVSFCTPYRVPVTIREVPVPTVWVTGRPPLSPWFEGSRLTFSVFAWPVPTVRTRVPIAVTDDTGGGDFLRAGGSSCPDVPADRHDCVNREGTRTVTFEPGMHAVQFTVRTVKDTTDEPDGSVTATVQTGNLWEVHATKGSVSQRVHDDDGTSDFSSTMTLGAPHRSVLSEGPPLPRRTPTGPGEAPLGCASDTSHASAAVMSLSTTGSYRQGLVRLLIDLGGTADYGDDYIIEIGDPDGSNHWYRADRHGREHDGTAGKGRIGWVVMDPANCLRVVALADRTNDTPETITLRVAEWDTTIGFHPAAHVDLSANTTHTITINTDQIAVNSLPTGDPGNGLDPPDDSAPEPSSDTADSGTAPVAPQVRYAAMIEWIRTDRINNHADDTAHTAWKRVLKALGDPAYADYPQPAMTSAQAQARYENTPWRAAWPNRGWDNTWDELWHAIAYAENWTPPTDNGQQPSDDGQHTAEPPAEPEITVSAGTAVTEGTAATFTLTASPAPAAPLTVKVNITATGDYGVTTGTRDVTVPTTGTATLTVPTADDQTDEPDGTTTATLQPGAGYTIAPPAAATVAVTDNDPPAGNAHTLTITANAPTDTGRPGQPLRFTVTASETAQQDVTVSYTFAARGVSPYLDYCLAPAGASPAGFGCASLPYDPAQPTGTATIPTGTQTAEIAVVIDPNAWIRPNAQIDLILTHITGANTITTPTATGNIQR